MSHSDCLAEIFELLGNLAANFSRNQKLEERLGASLPRNGKDLTANRS
jgi:hypothetical protein